MDSVGEEQQVEEETEEMDDEDEDEEEEEVEDEEDDMEEEEGEGTVGRRSGRGLTLKTLLKERVLEPGQGNMTINYLGNKFKGDLLPDGRIQSQETNKVFGTPSAWAIYCKKIVNPDKKSGCGWASVRYRGKKLDSYKNNWFRQKRLEYEKEEEGIEEEDSCYESEGIGLHEQEVIEFDALGNRSPTHDPATMVELTTFQSLARMQPFNITMSSSAMAVIDVHAHLTTSEVIGYLAGQWDVNNHNLIVSHAFPVRCRLGDADKGPAIEQELYAEMTQLKLSLVGWYHSHPFAPPLPSLRDIDSQLDYEMKMKGYNDASYTPVLGIIVSPYLMSRVYDKPILHANGNAAGFWVMPPSENKPMEYGRPMSMQFTLVQDAFIPKEALVHMSEVIKFYKDAPDAVTMLNTFEDKLSYWHKLKSSLKGRVPKDHFNPLIEFITKLLDEKLPNDDPVMPASCLTQSLISSMVPVSFTPEVEGDVITIKPISNPSNSEITSELIKEKDPPISLSPLIAHGSESPVTHVTRGKTPPPKIYSPASYQLPLPPLFPMDVGRNPSAKETQAIKNLFPHLTEEKKSDCLSSAKTQHKDRDLWVADLSSAAKSDVFSELALRLQKDALENSSSGSFLDFSLASGKEDKSKRMSSVDDYSRIKDDKLGYLDLSTWFVQAKLMQEALTQEREYQYACDMVPLFSPELLSSNWNPAAALQLSREMTNQKASFHQDLFLPKSTMSFSRDPSKPTYHSDVPFLLKKQDDLLQTAKGEIHDSKETKKYPEARDLLDFGVPKEGREKEFWDQRVRDRGPRDVHSHQMKEPLTSSIYRDLSKDSRDMKEFWASQDPKLYSKALFRDLTDQAAVFRDPTFSSNLRDILKLPRDVASSSKDSGGTDFIFSKLASKDSRPETCSADLNRVGEAYLLKIGGGEHQQGRLTPLREAINYKDVRDLSRAKEHSELHELQNLIEKKNFSDSSHIRKAGGSSDLRKPKDVGEAVTSKQKDPVCAVDLRPQNDKRKSNESQPQGERKKISIEEAKIPLDSEKGDASGEAPRSVANVAIDQKVESPPKEGPSTLPGEVDKLSVKPQGGEARD